MSPARPRRRGADDPGPRPLEHSLDSVSRQLGLEGSRGLGAVFSHWEQIVGPAVAEHVQPYRLDAEALVVTVDHPAWATQVRHLSESLLDRVTEQTGVPRPPRLDIRISR
jgi:predicted nucleic acid-binding Zn ribbon protein